jgi:hypothetical protein
MMTVVELVHAVNEPAPRLHRDGIAPASAPPMSAGLCRYCVAPISRKYSRVAYQRVNNPAWRVRVTE